MKTPTRPDRRGPGIGAGRARMTDEVKDVNHAVPYCLAVERFADGNGLHERRGAAMHLLDGVLAIVCVKVTPRYFIETLSPTGKDDSREETLSVVRRIHFLILDALAGFGEPCMLP